MNTTLFLVPITLTLLGEVGLAQTYSTHFQGTESPLSEGGRWTNSSLDWAISMYLAKFKHEGAAATWAGNSPNVIHKHYKGLVQEVEAAQFWALTPATGASEMIQFPARNKGGRPKRGIPLQEPTQATA